MAGRAGFTQDDVRSYVNQSQADPLMNECRRVVQEAMVEQVIQFLPLDNMRDIAKLLIEYGAEPNAEHMSPIQGYTPLMLATELDEDTIVGLMLENGGDLLKTYAHPGTGRAVSCTQIADFFGAGRVLKAIV